MGDVLASFDDLFYLRIWTAAEIAEIVDKFRWKRTVMAIDRQSFLESMQSRCPDAVRIFDDLDTDFDGKVDTFEVLLTLVVWSCTSWEEKIDLLFRSFDFNRKGALRFPELAFLIATTMRSTKKFVRLDLGLDDVSAQKAAAAIAFEDKRDGHLELEGFRAWFEASGWAIQLKQFVDSHTSSGAAPEVREAPVRRNLRMQDYHAQELSQELERLRSWAAQLDGQDVDRSDQQRGLYEVLSKRVAQLLKKLGCASETLKSELTELSASMNQDVRASGPSALVEPSSKLRHDQLRAEIDVLQRRCQEDCRETARLLEKMKELTYGTEKDKEAPALRRASEVTEAAMPPLLSTAAPQSPALDDDDRRRRILDRELKRKRAITRIGGPDDTIAQANRQYLDLPQYRGQKGAGDSNAPGATLRGASPTDAAGTYEPISTIATVAPAPAAEEDTAIVEEPPPEPEIEAMPIVVAFADFDPPPSHETQMLTLKVGDQITATGRDGGGWWYGTKVDGTEGWFPPSYVQLLEEYQYSTGG